MTIMDVLVDTVKVSTYSDVIDADKISNVINMLCHVRDSRLRTTLDEIIIKGHHHQSVVGSLDERNAYVYVYNMLP